MKRFISLGLALLLLTGCAETESWFSSTPQSGAACPTVRVLHPLSSYTALASPNGTPFDVISQGLLSTTLPTCRTDGDKTTVSFTTTVIATRGPSYHDDVLTFPYFVAVLDSEGNITAKNLHNAHFKKLVGRDGDVRREDFNVDVETGSSSEIVLGFQVSPDSLATTQR